MGYLIMVSLTDKKIYQLINGFRMHKRNRKIHYQLNKSPNYLLINIIINSSKLNQNNPGIKLRNHYII